MTEHAILNEGFDTRPIAMKPMWEIVFQAPSEDIDRIFDAILAITPLIHGKTDRNGFRTAPGTEYYRPLAGTPTGEEDAIRHRPSVHEMRFFLPRDTHLLEAVIEAIYAVHSYYESVITVTEVLRSHGKGLDDQENPHRWWNTTGDWKV